ncbi:hypothetical protein, partial [Dokdonella sp.]
MRSIVRSITVLILLIAPLLNGCIAVVATGAVATGSTVHDRRGFGTVVQDKRIQLGAYDTIN